MNPNAQPQFRSPAHAALAQLASLGLEYAQVVASSGSPATSQAIVHHTKQQHDIVAAALNEALDRIAVAEASLSADSLPAAG